MKPHRILLTGASGTLGRNFLELSGNDPNLEILVLLRQESRFHSKYASAREVRVDLWDREGVARIVADFKPATIIHCAATGMEFPKTEWFDLIRFNVDFTVNLCESAALSGGSHFIFIGTGLAYKSIPRPLNEADPLDTRHPYGASKAAADLLGAVLDLLPIGRRQPARNNPLERGSCCAGHRDRPPFSKCLYAKRLRKDRH